MTESRLWLIRHAESTWNAAGRWQGQADPPLSEKGRAQARQLAESLRAEESILAKVVAKVKSADNAPDWTEALRPSTLAAAPLIVTCPSTPVSSPVFWYVPERTSIDTNALLP